ncbi:Auxilin-related protein [Actinidia chinensis var. chinensis]|uniref:Auxilin-related protein n=1 Tax=Actinidia chinensis var. chinensis TaxID=1590841 RepID=A0A2R6QJK0_ACTCC|nr:Auxilin-related protein [Actinidia chinensis var. chinensis]
MDDFGTLARDFGFRPQGKSAPMAPPKSSFGARSDGVDRSSSSSRDGFLFNDVFGGPPKHTSAGNSKSASSMSDFEYDSIFKSSAAAAASDSKNRSSSPVYDKPVYDEDIFDGLPGLTSKSKSSSVRFDNDVFESISSNPKQNRNQSHSGGVFDDFLGNLGMNEKSEPKKDTSSRGLDDLIPGFGGRSPQSSRPFSESGRPQSTSFDSTEPTSDMMEDPFVVLESTSTPAASSPGLFTDPLEEIRKLGNSGNTKVSGSSTSGGVFDDIDPLDGFSNSIPAFSSEINNGIKEGRSSRAGSSMGKAQTSSSAESFGRSSFRNSEGYSQKKTSADNFQESHQTIFNIPSVSTDSRKSVGQTASPSYINTNSSETDFQVDDSPGSSEHDEPSDDVWITVSEIPLFTQPTSAPPPSRPPPPIPARASKSEAGFFTSNARKKGNEYSSPPNSSQYSQSPKSTHPPVKSTVVSQIDELEEFAMGRSRNNVDKYADIHSGEEVNANSSAAAAAAAAAAMKEVMDRAEAKFRHAKEVREREYAKTARRKEAVQLEKDEQAMQHDQEEECRENQERLDREQFQREEEERERRLEKERERAREIEREREKARQAVERATREARERAATEARLKAERAAVGKAQAEARERAERAAVLRAQAEARERAAAEARERAEKAAAEARERANAEAREKAAASRAEAEARRRAERTAVDRAAAEARERAAAAATRTNQQKNDNDFESFFSMGSRPSSAPRPRANSSDPMSNPQFQSKGRTEGARTSVSTSSNMRKASSTTNIVDDLSSIFGAAPSSGDFQEVEGETEERRRARLERHQRTQERAARALAEKNERDLQTQREQQERHRIAETLDVEIKRWSAGKEGNLRTLLSTLQYVLWPGCGWQPVSLTDLITGASVKKVYRKATLCIHPDKVQQKGATLQQKYVAEKVFDLLKEAWNKFNSEELF